MVFHNIENLTDVVSDHRIIIYYIENASFQGSVENVSSSLKSVLENLDKKNDDLLLIEVSKSSGQFSYFQAIYKPIICDGVTLFVINGEGIPVVSLDIVSKNDILEAISSLIHTCRLKPITNIESIIDSVKVFSNGTVSCPERSHWDNAVKLEEPMLHFSPEDHTGSTSSIDSASEPKKPRLSTQNDDIVSTTTKLQIRLPDGSKDVQKFDKEALLNEVQRFIGSKHKLTDYDLKTFNSPIFSSDDYEKTLQELELHPNGVIIVVPRKQVGQALNRNGQIGNFVQTGILQLISSTTSLIHFVQDFLFKIWVKFFSASNSNVRNSMQSQNARTGKEATSFQQKSMRYGSKPFGNIHTLRRNDDSDEENNRYNGNSTQQK